jgi:hypothetical protein
MTVNLFLKISKYFYNLHFFFEFLLIIMHEKMKNNLYVKKKKQKRFSLSLRKYLL